VVVADHHGRADRGCHSAVKLIDEWRRDILRLWSIRAALFWGALNGALLGLAAFIDAIDPYWFLILNIAGYATVAAARILKQPGADQ
jgi:hypothetical protein